MVSFRINKKAFVPAMISIIVVSILFSFFLIFLLTGISNSFVSYDDREVKDYRSSFPQAFVKAFLLKEVELDLEEREKLGFDEEKIYLIKDLLALEENKVEKIVEKERSDFLNFYSNYEISDSKIINIHESRKENPSLLYDEDLLLGIDYGESEVPEFDIVQVNNDYFYAFEVQEGEYNIIYFGGGFLRNG